VLVGIRRRNRERYASKKETEGEERSPKVWELLGAYQKKMSGTYRKESRKGEVGKCYRWQTTTERAAKSEKRSESKTTVEGDKRTARVRVGERTMTEDEKAKLTVDRYPTMGNARINGESGRTLEVREKSGSAAAQTEGNGKRKQMKSSKCFKFGEMRKNGGNLP